MKPDEMPSTNISSSGSLIIKRIGWMPKIATGDKFLMQI